MRFPVILCVLCSLQLRSFAFQATVSHPVDWTDVSVFSFQIGNILDENIIPVSVVYQHLQQLILFQDLPDNSTLNKRFLRSVKINKNDLASAFNVMVFHRLLQNNHKISSYLIHHLESPLKLDSNAVQDANYPQVLTVNWTSVVANDDTQTETTETHTYPMAAPLTSNYNQGFNVDQGEVTGYALLGTGNEIAPELFPPLSASHKKEVMLKMRHGRHKKVYAHPEFSHEKQMTPMKQNKEVSLRDIADIVFTTLAFLSFGMFILQVLICLTMTKDDTNNIMMGGMETVDGSVDGVEEIRRYRRSLPSSLTDNFQTINNISGRALMSMKTVVNSQSRDRSCYYYILCENNFYANQQLHVGRLWIPIWSLGISWLESELNSKMTGKVEKTWKHSELMQSLKAIFMGLTAQQCKIHYPPSKCKHLFFEE